VRGVEGAGARDAEELARLLAAPSPTPASSAREVVPLEPPAIVRRASASAGSPKSRGASAAGTPRLASAEGRSPRFASAESRTPRRGAAGGDAAPPALLEIEGDEDAAGEADEDIAFGVGAPLGLDAHLPRGIVGGEFRVRVATSGGSSAR
jgi:hypothetical protein